MSVSFVKRKNEADTKIDPLRLAGHSLVLTEMRRYSRKTYTVTIAGLKVGMIRNFPRPGTDRFWTWVLKNPAIPEGMVAKEGDAVTLAEAAEAMQQEFAAWHSWALKQGGLVGWTGANSSTASRPLETPNAWAPGIS